MGVPLEASSWFAVYGPSAMAAEVQNRLSAAVRQVVESAEFRKRAEEQGAKAIAMTPAELHALGTKERAQWERVIKAAN
jgi:tripartite-type tricarboxylate transporter receptor subunit TctC